MFQKQYARNNEWELDPAMGTITKALELLAFFSRANPSIGLTDFVRLAQRDKATVHRHLVELEQNGFLEQDKVSRAYRLGPAILRLTGVREATFPMRAVLRPLVTQMAEDAGELVHVSLLQGDFMSPVFHADPKRHGTAVSFDEAQLQPLHATASGLAALAFTSDKLRKHILSKPLKPYTDRTITDATTLQDTLHQIRRYGVARSDRAFDPEVASQGVPLFDQSGDVIGALSIAVPTVRLDEGRLALLESILRGGMAAVTVSLGGNIPPSFAALWADTDPSNIHSEA